MKIYNIEQEIERKRQRATKALEELRWIRVPNIHTDGYHAVTAWDKISSKDVEKCIQKGADIYTKMPDGATWIENIIKSGNIDVVNTLVKDGAIDCNDEEHIGLVVNTLIANHGRYYGQYTYVLGEKIDKQRIQSYGHKYEIEDLGLRNLPPTYYDKIFQALFEKGLDPNQKLAPYGKSCISMCDFWIDKLSDIRTNSPVDQEKYGYNSVKKLKEFFEKEAAEHWSYTNGQEGTPIEKRYIPKDKNGVLNGTEKVYKYIPEHMEHKLVGDLSPAQIEVKTSDFAIVHGDVRFEEVIVPEKWLLVKTIDWEDGTQKTVVDFDENGRRETHLYIGKGTELHYSFDSNQRVNYIKRVIHGKQDHGRQDLLYTEEDFYAEIDGVHKLTKHNVCINGQLVYNGDEINKVAEFYENGNTVKEIHWGGKGVKIIQRRYDEQNPNKLAAVIITDRFYEGEELRCMVEVRDHINNTNYDGVYDEKGYLVSVTQRDQNNGETNEFNYRKQPHRLAPKSVFLPRWIKPKVDLVSIILQAAKTRV